MDLSSRRCHILCHNFHRNFKHKFVRIRYFSLVHLFRSDLFFSSSKVAASAINMHYDYYYCESRSIWAFNHLRKNKRILMQLINRCQNGHKNTPKHATWLQKANKNIKEIYWSGNICCATWNENTLDIHSTRPCDGKNNNNRINKNKNEWKQKCTNRAGIDFVWALNLFLMYFCERVRKLNLLFSCWLLFGSCTNGLSNTSFRIYTGSCCINASIGNLSQQKNKSPQNVT